MGARGPVKKQGAQRRGGAKGQEVEPAKPLVGMNLVPDPPAGLMQETKDIWFALWDTDVAMSWRPSDVLVVRRYVSLLDERARHDAQLHVEGHVVAGSRGQDTAHPLLSRLAQIDTQLTQLEDRLGLSPLSRSRLGLVTAQGQLTVEGLKAAMQEAAARQVDPRG